MTCNQLGGACEQVFSGETFDDLAAQSQQHGKSTTPHHLSGKGCCSNGAEVAHGRVIRNLTSLSNPETLDEIKKAIQ